MSDPFKSMFMLIATISAVIILVFFTMSELGVARLFNTKNTNNLAKTRDDALLTELTGLLDGEVHGSNIYKVFKQDSVYVKMMRVYNTKGELECIYKSDKTDNENSKFRDDDYRYFIENSWKLYDVNIVIQEGINYYILISELDENLKVPKSYEEDVTPESSIWRE